jgi:N-dimethylarginine dimethylaminohydrolase
MEKITLHIANEYDALTHVVMGTGLGYHRDKSQVEIVNETQKNTFSTGAYPTESSIAREFDGFRQALVDNGAHVYEPKLAPDTVQDQTCPRDIGFVIGDTLVIAAMSVDSRKQEFEGIAHHLDGWQGKVLRAPDDVALEGGDVIIDQGRLFVGVGQRSNTAGLAFLTAHFGDQYQIVPMPCASLAQGEDVLHLDCTFQPLGLGHALIYPEGITDIPAVITDTYTLIPVDRAEAGALATNIFSIAPGTVIARTARVCARVNKALRTHGYKVIEVPFDLVPGTGGSFRCATMPVRRA